jgi:alpha-beta hydrolase superfamily lysophospholipase
MRTVTPLQPTELGVRDGLSYSLWLPPRADSGVAILHGAGSSKENHHDFARAAVAAGIAAIAFDLRGHGSSEGALDDRVLDDVAAIVSVLRERTQPGLPIALRGSSMGGYLAILAALRFRVQAVVAICPASAEGLRRGLVSGQFEFAADEPSLVGFLETHELSAAVRSLDIPLLLLHAEGDERVPVEQSRELAAQAPGRCRLLTVPGGHHRSVQHDPEMRALSLRWIARALAQ